MRFVVLLLFCLAAMTMVDDSEGQVAPEQHPNRHLLPNDDACGAHIADRIVGGNTAELGEYPWLAILGRDATNVEPQLGEKTIFVSCGGSLINSRYVLTAAHCLEVDPSEGLPPNVVRLGEHDPRLIEDCVFRGAVLVCADPVQDFNMEQTIVHPNYQPMFFRNDIALVRLDRPATFNPYVSPICMPFGDWRTRNYVGSEFWIAGFGRVEPNLTGDVLEELKVPVLPNKMCTNATYPDLVGANQICAGGRAGQDSCKGDSGGPLMGIDHFGSQYRVIGVISYGVRTECGINNAPMIFTRVGNYLNWIMSNMQA